MAGEAWWVVTGFADAEGSVTDYRVDAAMPAELSGDRVVRFVDLDLDLSLEGRSISVEDVDQFRARAERMGYSERVSAQAWEGLDDAAHRFFTGAWPFDGWLERVLGPGGPGG